MFECLGSTPAVKKIPHTFFFTFLCFGKIKFKSLLFKFDWWRPHKMQWPEQAKIWENNKKLLVVCSIFVAFEWLLADLRQHFLFFILLAPQKYLILKVDRKTKTFAAIFCYFHYFNRWLKKIFTQFLASKTGLSKVSKGHILCKIQFASVF